MSTSTLFSLPSPSLRTQVIFWSCLVDSRHSQPTSWLSMLIFPAPVFLFSSFVLWQAIHASSFAFSSGSSPEKEEQQQQQTHYSLRHSDINLPSIKSGASYFFGYSNSKANRWTLPYAKAPVGDLRFADPVALDDWAAVLAGLGHTSSVLPNACPQPDGSGDEDCLYLNVYAPLGGSIGSKLPVFVWVHGKRAQFRLFRKGAGEEQESLIRRCGLPQAAVSFKVHRRRQA